MALNPGRLYVLGMLTSFGLAQIFWSLVNYLRPGVVLLDNRYSSLPNQIVNVTEDDVLLAITHRRYSRQTDLTIHSFSGLGAKVVLLTDSALNPIATLADHVLVSPSNGPFLFDSHSTALTLIECLAVAMADHLEPNIRDRFQTMDDLFKHYGSFSPGLDYNLAQRVRKPPGRTAEQDQPDGREPGMRTYIIKRLIQAVGICLVISMISFFLLFLNTDPALLLLPPEAEVEDIEIFKHQTGLDRPVIIQYLDFLRKAVFTGDFGESFVAKVPAMRLIADRFPATLKLTLAALIFVNLVAVPVGVIAAIRRYSIWDNIATFTALVGQALPLVLVRDHAHHHLRGLAGLAAHLRVRLPGPSDPPGG